MKMPFAQKMICFLHLSWLGFLFWHHQRWLSSEIFFWFGLFSVFWLVLLGALLRGKAFSGAVSVVVLMIFQVASLFFSQQVTHQDVFVVFLLLIYSLWLFFELGQSYYCRGLHWYEGHPSCYPVQCSVYFGDKNESRVHLKPFRLSFKGLAACSDEAVLKGCQLYDTVRVVLLFRGKTVFVPAVVMQFFRSGVGLRFFFQCKDEKKLLLGFVEHLQGVGFHTE